MIYAYVFGSIRKFARAATATEARGIFARSIKAELIERANALPDDDKRRAVILAELASARVSKSAVFAYAADWENAVSAPSLDDAIRSVSSARDGYAKLRAYQKPSRFDWSHSPKRALEISRRNIFAYEYDDAEIEVVTIA